MSIAKMPLRTMLFAAVSTIPFAAQAQPATAAGAQEADKDIIIVTATRREGTVQDVPINISAVGSEQLGGLVVAKVDDSVLFVVVEIEQEGAIVGGWGQDRGGVTVGPGRLVDSPRGA